MTYPNYIIHYHHNQAVFLHSVLENGYTKAKEILSKSPVARISREEYVDERLMIEGHIRNEFYKKGGFPRRHFPLYACLGESKYLEQDCFTKYIIPLSVFTKEQISFTFTDSMFSVHGLKPEVYLVDELDMMVERHGLKFPEVQIWDDKPIIDWIESLDEKKRLKYVREYSVEVRG